MNYKYYNPRKAALDTARELLTGALNAAVADGSLPEAPLPEFIVEIPADVKNGDIASNAAMAGARAFHKAPRQIAQAIVDHLNLEGSLFDRAEIAGPGFINLFLGAHWFTSVLQAAATEPEYGRTDGGAGKRYNVEFVSANPTGPMHMGNARGGALGDCLAACLDWAGYDVTREFYINDAGNQIQKFGKSLAIRYLQLYKGEEAVPLPEECYQGADIIARAKEFAEIHGDSYVDKDFEELKDALIADALPKNIAGLQRDLGKYRITYDVWFHESDLHKSGAVDDVIKILMDKGACYKAEDGAIMYRSAQYASKYGVVNRKKDENADGEEEAKDEVLVRANGIPTYFAADIAYHRSKFERGFSEMIYVLGADHGGYVKRLEALARAVSGGTAKLTVLLCQLVKLYRDGEPVKMSKRSGDFVTLRDVVEEVGRDSVRFMMIYRKSSEPLDFDFAKVTEPLTMGANSEALERPNGPKGLLETYGIEVGFTPIEDGGGPLTVKALKDNAIQIAIIYTADPSIASNDLVSVEDTKGLFLASNVVPLASDAVTDEAAAVINEISAAMGPEELIALNERSVTEQLPDRVQIHAHHDQLGGEVMPHIVPAKILDVRSL